MTDNVQEILEKVQAMAGMGIETEISTEMIESCKGAGTFTSLKYRGIVMDKLINGKPDNMVAMMFMMFAAASAKNGGRMKGHFESGVGMFTSGTPRKVINNVTKMLSNMEIKRTAQNPITIITMVSGFPDIFMLGRLMVAPIEMVHTFHELDVVDGTLAVMQNNVEKVYKFKVGKENPNKPLIKINDSMVTPSVAQLYWDDGEKELIKQGLIYYWSFIAKQKNIDDKEEQDKAQKWVEEYFLSGMGDKFMLADYSKFFSDKRKSVLTGFFTKTDEMATKFAETSSGYSMVDVLLYGCMANFDFRMGFRSVDSVNKLMYVSKPISGMMYFMVPAKFVEVHKKVTKEFDLSEKLEKMMTLPKILSEIKDKETFKRKESETFNTAMMSIRKDKAEAEMSEAEKVPYYAKAKELEKMKTKVENEIKALKETEESIEVVEELKDFAKFLYKGKDSSFDTKETHYGANFFKASMELYKTVEQESSGN
jgi:hypothetical protein